MGVPVSAPFTILLHLMLPVGGSNQAAPPDPPYNVTLLSCFSNSARLKWDFDKKQNFPPLENFIVEYNTSFTPNDWVVASRPAPESRDDDVRLSPWVKYNFRVRAENSMGVSEPGYNTHVCQTPQGRPFRHPRKVKAVTDKTNYLVVEWEPMPLVEHNAPGFFYKITVKERVGELVRTFIEMDYEVWRREILVNKVYRPYEITVQAGNQMGQPFREADTVVGFSGEAVPITVPENFALDPSVKVTATSAGFQWDPVDTSAYGMQGAFKGYKIRFWIVNQKQASVKEVFFPSNKTQQQLVYNLPAYTNIEADVVAVNNHFQSNGSNTVTFSIPEGRPLMEVMNSTKSSKVAEGQNVTIICDVSLYKGSVVRWYKDGQELSGGRFQIQTPGNLLIKDVKISDSGIYVCDKSSRFGGGSARRTLIVREKTRISTPPQDLKLLYQSNATFTCQAIGDALESVEYIWMRDGQRVDNGNPRVDIVDDTLTIIDINSQDTGDYVCVAKTDLDNATAKAKLEVKAPPDPPYNVTLLSCYSDFARLKWSFSKKQENFSPLENFIVEYNTSFTPDEWVVASRPSPESRGDKVRLSLWVKYNFRVRAENSMGVSEPGYNTHVCQTPQGRPFRHPRKVETATHKTNYLVVEWEPMPQIEHNAPDFFYSITVKEKDGDLVMNFVERDYTVGRKEIFVNKIYKPYEITVRAQNQIGRPFIHAQTIVGFSGESAPKQAPEHFELNPDTNVTATSAGFQWDPVDTSTESVQGEFKGYTIRFWKAGHNETTMKEVFFPQTESQNQHLGHKVRAAVDILPPYSDLEADIVTFNNYFSSSGSASVSFSTPEGVPSAVEYVKALYRGSTHFLLEWGEPVEPNGVITGYKVGYRTTDGLELGDMVLTETVHRRRMFLGGLTPNRLYRVYVWCLTRAGQGAEYYTDLQTTNATMELARPTIAHLNVTSTSVNVTWRLPEGYSIRAGARYVLQCRQKGKLKWKKGQEEESEDFWQVFKGLRESTTYKIRVVTSAGQPGTQDYTRSISKSRQFTTEEKLRPTIEDIVTLYTVADVKWRLSGKTRNHLGVLFFLQYRKIGESLWDKLPAPIQGNGTIFTQRIQDLEQFTSYEARIVPSTRQDGLFTYRASKIAKFNTSYPATAPPIIIPIQEELPADAPCKNDSRNLVEIACSLKDKVKELEQEQKMLREALTEERKARRRLEEFVYRAMTSKDNGNVNRIAPYSGLRNSTQISSPIYKEPPRRLTDLHGTILTVLFCVGFLCNSLTILVLRRRNSLGTRLLLYITYADIVFIVLLYVQAVLKEILPQDTAALQVLRPFTYPLLRTVFTAEAYVTVLIAIQRVLILSVPLRFIHFTRDTVFNKALAGIVLFSVVFNVPEWIMSRPDLYWNEYLNKTLIRVNSETAFSVKEYQLFKVPIDTILPLAIILISDGIMIISCLRSVPRSGQDSRIRGRNRLTKIVVAITTSSVILDMTVTAIYCVIMFNVFLNDSTELYLNFGLLVLLFTNSSINFIFYCLLGPEFRHTLKCVFRR